MNRLSGKRDTEIKTVVTTDVRDDLVALATIHRVTTGHLLRHIVHQYLYGRHGLISMGVDATELKG